NVLAGVLVAACAVEPADAPGLRAEMDRPVEDPRRDVRSPHEDLPPYIAPEIRLGQRLPRSRHADVQLPADLSPDAEDPLDEGAARLDGDPLALVHLDDRPVDVGVDLNRNRRLAEQGLARDRGDAPHRAAGAPQDLRPALPEEG